MSIIQFPPTVPAEPERATHINVKALWRYLRDLASFTSTEFTRRAVTDEAIPYVFLQSPNGSVWQVSIDNTGTINTTLIQGISP